MRDKDPLHDTDQTDRIEMLYQQMLMYEEALNKVQSQLEHLEGELRKVRTAVSLLHDAAHCHSQRLEVAEREIRRHMPTR